MTFFSKLLQAKQVNREDFYTYWLLSQGARTEPELSELLAVSIRTVQRSLSRLRKAHLVRKTDRVGALWAVVPNNNFQQFDMTNMSQHNTQYITNKTSLFPEQDKQGTLQDSYCTYLVTPAPEVSATPETAGTNVPELASLACQLLNLPAFSSPNIARQLVKINGVNQAIVEQAAEVTLREVACRKSGYKPIKNPVGYFLMVIRRKVVQRREIMAIKTHACNNFGRSQVETGQAVTLPSTEAECVAGKIPAGGEKDHQVEQVEQVLQEIRQMLAKHATYFVPQWPKWMGEVVGQLLPAVGGAKLVDFVQNQINLRSDHGVILATQPRVLGQWANQCFANSAAVVAGNDFDMYQEEVFSVVRSHCADLGLAPSADLITSFAKTVGTAISRGIVGLTAVYFRVSECDGSKLLSWLHSPGDFLTMFSEASSVVA